MTAADLLAFGFVGVVLGGFASLRIAVRWRTVAASKDKALLEADLDYARLCSELHAERSESKERMRLLCRVEGAKGRTEELEARLAVRRFIEQRLEADTFDSLMATLLAARIHKARRDVRLVVPGFAVSDRDMRRAAGTAEQDRDRYPIEKQENPAVGPDQGGTVKERRDE